MPDNLAVSPTVSPADPLADPPTGSMPDSLTDYRFDRGRWARLSFEEQMGNIGSEVGRAIAAHRTGRQQREDRAIDRAIDLFSATTEALVGTPYSYRLKEVLRARDEFLRLFFDGTFEADAHKIERYFMDFAFMARAGR
jgi:hypothetical protein